MSRALAKANANVALAKYWGKRDERLNLPYTGSISVTLDGLETHASVRPLDSGGDRIILSGVEAEPREAARISRFLDLTRAAGRQHTGAEVEISSNFPVAAGIASSASTFAALAVAAAAAYELRLSEHELSILARRGSGSACRSLFAGFAEWFVGQAPDGSDSYAAQLATPEHWQLGVVVAVTDPRPKAVGSREGMAQAVSRSPLFSAWVDTHKADLDDIRDGVRERDLARIGHAAEHNCLKMHAVSLAAQPPLIYWRPATLAVIERVRQLREEGVDAYFTIDAGPQVKVICPIAQRAAVAETLGAVSGVQRVLLSAPGPAPQLLEAS